ncbi:hypothetical protein [Pseudomonas yamanorum]
MEVLKVLSEIELIHISLRDMGSFYADKPFALEEYRKETTAFIDDFGITTRLAQIRNIISKHFDDTLEKDDMDDIGRRMVGLEFWKPKPYN